MDIGIEISNSEFNQIFDSSFIIQIFDSSFLIYKCTRILFLVHRKSILEEEEKQLLLKHAPHLMPYFTPELRARLRQLLWYKVL